MAELIKPLSIKLAAVFYLPRTTFGDVWKYEKTNGSIRQKILNTIRDSNWGAKTVAIEGCDKKVNPEYANAYHWCGNEWLINADHVRCRPEMAIWIRRKGTPWQTDLEAEVAGALI